MKRLCLLITVLMVTAGCLNLYAQQTNFQVTIPPIPWYEFNKGDRDLKVNGTLLYLTGEIVDPDAGGDVDVYGAGASGFYRYAFLKKFAVDAGGLVLGAGGNVGPYADMGMTILSVPADIEFQPVKSDRFSVILFLGFSFTWLGINIDYNDGSDEVSMAVSSSMRGPQGGIQVAVKYTDFVITPFFMITSLSGDADIDINYDGDEISVPTGIPTSTSYFYGIDIVYLPWDITLSSILQQALSSGDNQDYQTYVLTVSYHFQLDDGEKTIEIPAATTDKKKPVRKKKQINSNNKSQQQ